MDRRLSYDEDRGSGHSGPNGVKMGREGFACIWESEGESKSRFIWLAALIPR